VSQALALRGMPPPASVEQCTKLTQRWLRGGVGCLRPPSSEQAKWEEGAAAVASFLAGVWTEILPMWRLLLSRNIETHWPRPAMASAKPSSAWKRAAQSSMAAARRARTEGGHTQAAGTSKWAKLRDSRQAQKHGRSSSASTRANAIDLEADEDEGRLPPAFALASLHTTLGAAAAADGHLKSYATVRCPRPAQRVLRAKPAIHHAACRAHACAVESLSWRSRHVARTPESRRTHHHRRLVVGPGRRAQARRGRRAVSQNG
jgi:hypothetical protein